MTGAADIHISLSDNSLNIEDVEDKIKMVEFEPTVNKTFKWNWIRSK